jgi:predicted ester cyclase
LSEEKNILLVKRAIEALNTGDLSGVPEFIGSSYFNHESQMDPVRSKMRGPEEFMDTVRGIRAAISDIHYEEVETLASNDKVVSIVTVTGKHTGSFFDFIPPTGNDIRYQAVHIHRIGDDGKIVEHRAIRDDLALMYQLGVIKGSSPQYDDFLKGWKSAK